MVDRFAVVLQIRIYLKYDQFYFVGLSENLTSSYDCLSYNAWSNAFYVTDGGEALQFHSSFPALYGDRISIVLPDAWGLRRQPIFQ